MEFNNITRKHVLDAIDKIESESINLEPSTKFDVIINGKAYPPKEVMRYANMLANGTKEWPFSGGEQTNKFLENLNFEVVSNSDEFRDTKENLIKLLKKIGPENATIFFDCASQLLKKLNVKEGDQRLTFGTSSNYRLTITIGQRYCLGFKAKTDLPWIFILGEKITLTDDIDGVNFRGIPEAYYYECRRAEEMQKRLDKIAEASLKELQRIELSRHRKSNNDIFEKALFDINYRNDLFNIAFNLTINLTGNVWKLGCRWGSGKPSFYELIKTKSIVIGVSDRLYSIGDLIIITEGHTVYALGKVLENPKPVIHVPTFETEFNKYEIEYNDTINYAKAEWYELAEDEIFQYQLQQGICKVNVPEVRNRAITIWNDRFINYWIFQCNPSEFDFATAVRMNLLHNWTIVAHKDRIKSGDKVILWLTGKRAGCYALARVTSEPMNSTSTESNHLWKTEPKISLKANIEITHKLLDNPILWEYIKDNEDLKDLKVGNQGTNFTATRKEYNTLLKLVENRSDTMNIDLFINTILYGPPGTGKTYQLNKYKEKYFTDTGIIKTSEEVLREKIKNYPFWRILAAVLFDSGNSQSVSDLLNNPIVIAKITPNAKTPRNTLWRILQSYADNESTQMEDKYRGPLKIFHKDENSKWSIKENEKNEIAESLDQELLDLVANPKLPSEKSVASITRFNFITFHQKYSYEDFIEGIKPLLRDGETDVDQISGDLQFELKKGIFYNSCLESLKLVGYSTFEECFNDTIENRVAKFTSSKNNPSKQFALFIDEINRANISAVFGELITLLEDDKRIGAENEMWVELPYSNEKFCVPANLYVIGTMNTADRSIALLDIALRRRFEFKALYPLYMEKEWWASQLRALNLAIHNWKKNPDFFIGHAFFINKLESDNIKILNTKIIPLLYEYCQNNADTVKKILYDAGIKVRATSINDNFQIIAE
jgi:hypothetical protein